MLVELQLLITEAPMDKKCKKHSLPSDGHYSGFHLFFTVLLYVNNFKVEIDLSDITSQRLVITQITRRLPQYMNRGFMKTC